MKKYLTILFVAVGFVFFKAEAQELIMKESPHTMEQTAARLKKNIESMGLTIIAHIDHAGAAAKNGLELSPTEVFIFGNPKVGTLLMQEDPRCGLDLPLKMLVWEQAGKTFVSYRDPSFLAKEYNVRTQKEIVTKMQEVLKKIADQTVQK